MKGKCFVTSRISATHFLRFAQCDLIKLKNAFLQFLHNNFPSIPTHSLLDISSLGDSFPSQVREISSHTGCFSNFRHFYPQLNRLTRHSGKHTCFTLYKPLTTANSPANVVCYPRNPICTTQSLKFTYSIFHICATSDCLKSISVVREAAHPPLRAKENRNN